MNFGSSKFRGVPEREDIVLFYVDEEEKTVLDLSRELEINEENENQFHVVVEQSPKEAGKYVVRRKSNISIFKNNHIHNHNHILSFATISRLKSSSILSTASRTNPSAKSCEMNTLISADFLSKRTVFLGGSSF